jgi:CheY-like chemotaxis protein
MNNRILLVDDEETIRYVLREALIGEGYNVDIAHDAFQAIERFKMTPYDLIITDIKMHGMDGLQLIREVRKDDSLLNIIIITAYGSLETVKEAAQLGVIEMISKPFKIQEIKDAIARTLKENEVSDEKEDKGVEKQHTIDNEQLTKVDNLLKPAGLSYYFSGPAYQPKSTVVFDSIAINESSSMLIFGNINSQSEHHREWWENCQIGLMIKTLFRLEIEYSPSKKLDSINKFLCKNIIPHINVSMLCVLIDKSRKVIKYVNNGSNLVCSMIVPNGVTEILDGNPCPLGFSPEIELIESTLTYSEENRLMLSRSNSMSKIVEDGAMIKQKIDSALHSIRSLDMKRALEFNLNTPFINDRDLSFDDETVLLVSLDDGNTENVIDSETLKINNKIAESLITIN